MCHLLYKPTCVLEEQYFYFYFQGSFLLWCILHSGQCSLISENPFLSHGNLPNPAHILNLMTIMMTIPNPVHIMYWMTIITMIITIPLLLMTMMTMIRTIAYSKYLNGLFHYLSIYNLMIWLERCPNKIHLFKFFSFNMTKW